MLNAAAEEIFHLGPVGNGMRAKLVNNAVARTTMVMIVEAAAIAAKAGVPMDVFYTLMSRDGAFDGYSGLAMPTVDGTSTAANQAVYGLMLETIRMAGEAAAAA